FPPVLPNEVTGIKVAPQGRRVEHTQITRMKDPAGRDMLWIGDFPSDDPLEHATDLGAILDRMVSVTPLHCDLTHGATLQKIAGLFGKPKRAGRAKRR